MERKAHLVVLKFSFIDRSTTFSYLLESANVNIAYVVLIKGRTFFFNIELDSEKIVIVCDKY